MMIQWFNNRLTMVNDVGYTWTFLLLPWPILDTLQKMTTSSLVKVDNPIDTTQRTAINLSTHIPGHVGGRMTLETGCK